MASRRKILLIDVLAMTISSEPEGARITLESLRKVREIYGVCTVLGVSNISFGLPYRPVSQFQFLHNGNAERSECRNYQSSVRRYDAFILFLLCIDESMMRTVKNISDNTEALREQTEDYCWRKTYSRYDAQELQLKKA